MKILHFADLHLGVESYGKLDPATGISSRFLDFLASLDRLVDYALQDKVDLVLFCGDAYKSREPSTTQQREFARRISRLSSSGVPVFLLVGNHDLPNAVGKATTTEIFDTLAVKNVYVSSRPDIYPIPTPSGTVQIASLPWLRRGALLAREENRNLTLEQLNRKAQEVLTGIIAHQSASLDPHLPSILAAHVWVTGATLGSEKGMTLGQEPTLLPSVVANPAFDYVALGHIHRHQVVHQHPPVVYAGSLERLDFNEEEDEKGFYLVQIEGKEVAYTLHPVPARRFLTITANIEPEDVDPTATVLRAIEAHQEPLKDAIVRLQVSLPEGTQAFLRDGDIRNALKDASYFTIAREVRREARTRLGRLAAEEIAPLEALKLYLESKKVPPERASVLLEHGQKLIGERKAKMD